MSYRLYIYTRDFQLVVKLEGKKQFLHNTAHEQNIIVLREKRCQFRDLTTNLSSAKRGRNATKMVKFEKQTFV